MIDSTYVYRKFLINWFLDSILKDGRAGKRRRVMNSCQSIIDISNIFIFYINILHIHVFNISNMNTPSIINPSSSIIPESSTTVIALSDTLDTDFLRWIKQDIDILQQSIEKYWIPTMRWDIILEGRFILWIDTEWYNRRQYEIDNHKWPSNQIGINEFDYGERVEILRKGDIWYHHSIDPWEAIPSWVSESDLEFNEKNCSIHIRQTGHHKRYQDWKCSLYDFQKEDWISCSSEEFKQSYNVVSIFLKGKIQELIDGNKIRELQRNLS